MPGACIVGLGRSGIAAARLLHRQGWTVTVSDSGNADTLQQTRQQLEAEGITVLLDHRFTPDPAFQQVIVSPGVRWDLPALLQAREQDIETLGEMELAWRSLPNSPWLGITGTNGKTTTTALIAAIFQAAGLCAPACGNIGFAACEVALKAQAEGHSPDWIIAEISSYQIESSATLAPRIGVWTTFTPDHLSRHYTLENYYAIKAKLLNHSQSQIFNGDDPYLRQVATSWPDAYWTSVTGKDTLPGQPTRGAWIEDGWAIAMGAPIVPVSALRMVGSHNHQNLLMAVLAAKLAGIETEAITRAIETFPGVAHRLEHICTWQGVAFINDSKATNYDAAEVGLTAVEAPAILIAGGEAKDGDDTGWLKTIQQKAAAVLLIGSAAPAFAQQLESIGYTTYEIVETMDRAIARSTTLAQQYNARVVLLSPACASFDQYQSFEHRGDHFRELCKAALV
ncbi:MULTISPECIES: UDP-N-acetylmuramoyl-L-alanine--D-glutamate ligase [unclassified Leptolyngbya]|uniref:UDP-N-acetylmuramoyl-L-alanine--D-glutamate ligase n=1 Tax=unclassified Leptolyngbya TaxID=2650499 RepID=UPI001684E055|nr:MULTISPECIES: UDP-N-acetylmuramoyl-L-alanine--D-glutamate ligase [unclassified Leptolyngbya]MBD1911947.1 UDP-N-acetylmuramoyl-L-alanine--D-glutamate ligase [Leptolyngbya sp. FACHB-8]MBD2154248.1 UDP-N-acetylmuramoyl-L-alanine--D-glutamate ligase [Leptolyngbya sp. FACHB-16]